MLMFTYRSLYTVVNFVVDFFFVTIFPFWSKYTSMKEVTEVVAGPT
jgi:hypothetical protein